MNAVDLAARLDRLPVSRFHRRVLYGLAFAFFFELADLNTFAYVAPALKKYQGTTVGEIAWITSASFLGMFLGAAIGGRLADVLGRKRALVVSVLWYSVFSLLNAAAIGVTTLFVARLLTGVGLSAMTVIAITYIAETMPREWRGRMQSVILAVGLIGIPAMAFFSRAVVPLSPNSWRWVFCFGALGFIALVFILRLPESPRWVLLHRSAAEAEAVLRHIEDEVAHESGPLAEPTTASVTEEEHGLGKLFAGSLGRRTVMLWIAWIFQTLGFYGFVAWVPTLLEAQGLSLTKSLTFSALTTLGAVPGALLAWPVSDRLGRKYPLIVVSVVIAICGIIYGLTLEPVVIVVFGFLVSFFIQTFAALLYAYTPEMYPTALRNTGSGIAYGVGRLANIAGPFIVAGIFAGAGYIWVFVYIAACWVAVALAVLILGPKTGRISLERLQHVATRAPEGNMSASRIQSRPKPSQGVD